MLAERSLHSSEAFFHSEPQLDLLAPWGMMPKDPMGGLPLMLRAIMPKRKGSPSAPVNPMSPSKSEMRDPSSPAPIKALSGLSKNACVGPHLVREVAAHCAFARVWIVGRTDFGKQQQPRVVQRERRQHDGRGGLEELLAVLAGELDPGGAAILVHDAPYPASRA